MITVTPVSPGDFPPQSNLFQTAFWGMFKQSTGQLPLFFSVSFSDESLPGGRTFPFMVLIRPCSDGSSYAYAPHAPSVAVPDLLRGILLEELAPALRPFLPEDCICIRYDLYWRSLQTGAELVNREAAEICMNWRTKSHTLFKAPVDYLCPDTIIIDLSLTPEQMLARMRGTTRNCIRRAYRSGIDFQICGGEKLSEWYALYRSTAERKHFYYEQQNYFERLFALSSSPSPDAFARAEQELEERQFVCHIPVDAPAPIPRFHLLTASKNGTMLSGIILALCGTGAYYLYAGSSTEQRDLMPNYGIQWEALRFARSCGCTSYDLMGIPPNGDKIHSMAGLYIFKTGFGGDHVRFAGTWDFPYDQSRYEAFRMEETLSRKTR